MMTLHSLTITNVRAIEHLHLEQLPETGVIVIHGDNEAGKSTILDALDAVLNAKHNSMAKDIKALKPVDRDAAPEVSATLTIGPVTFRVAKRWLKKKGAELTVTAPARESHTGGDAEERLAEILKDHLDPDLLKTLFLRQEDLGGAIKAAGIASLSNALGAARAEDDADSVDAAEDDDLMRAVDKEYLRYFTRRGDQASSVKKSVQDWEKSVADLDEATAELERLQDYVDQVADSEAERDRGEEQLPKALAALESAEAGLTTARATQEKAIADRADHERAARDLDTARQAVSDRARRCAELADLTEQSAAMAADVDAAREAAEEEQQRLTELRAELDDAREQRTAVRARLAEASATRRRVADHARRTELRGLLTTLDELDKRIVDLRAGESGHRISDADVRAVEAAASEAAIAAALRDRAVPKLELSATAATTVSVDGVDAELSAEPTSVELSDGTEITVGEVTATYRAGEAAGDDAVRRAEEADQSLAALLSELECESPEQVRQARDDATRLAEELVSAQRERVAVLAGRDSGDLRAEAARLDQELGDADAETDVDADAAAKAARAVAEAEAENERLEAEIARIEQTMAPWQEGTAAKKHVEIATRVDQLNTQITAASATLEQLEEAHPQESLAAAVTAAEEELAARAQTLAEAEAAVAVADPEQHEALVEAASSRVSSIQTRVKNATLTLATLSGRIDQAAGAAERVEKARAREGRLRRHVEQLESRAAAAQRLREVLLRHRSAARARYAQPFADELTRLAATVFGPEVEFTLSEDLEVTQRTVGDVTVPLDALSGGAKEQLAILTRFAIAGLIGRGAGEEGARAVPVVVDDALGSTDPRRLQLMNTLFTRMGKQTQVLVLTCFPNRYDWVAGKTEYSMAQLKTAR